MEGLLSNMPLLLEQTSEALKNGDTFQLVSIDPSTIIFTWINLAIIVFLYRFFLHIPVTKILDKRKDAINAEVNEAKEAKAKAAAVEREYLELLSNSKEEAAKIVAAAVQRAQAREEEIIREAENEALLIRQKADEDIARERKRAVNEIKNQISELVIMAAQAVAEKEIDENDNEELINSFLVNVGEK